MSTNHTEGPFIVYLLILQKQTKNFQLSYKTYSENLNNKFVIESVLFIYHLVIGLLVFVIWTFKYKAVKVAFEYFKTFVHHGKTLIFV